MAAIPLKDDVGLYQLMSGVFQQTHGKDVDQVLENYQLTLFKQNQTMQAMYESEMMTLYQLKLELENILSNSTELLPKQQLLHQLNLEEDYRKQFQGEIELLSQISFKAEEAVMSNTSRLYGYISLLLDDYQPIPSSGVLTRNRLNSIRVIYSQVVFEQSLAYLREYFRQLQSKRQKMVSQQRPEGITVSKFKKPQKPELKSVKLQRSSITQYFHENTTRLTTFLNQLETNWKKIPLRWKLIIGATAIGGIGFVTISAIVAPASLIVTLPIYSMAVRTAFKMGVRAGNEIAEQSSTQSMASSKPDFDDFEEIFFSDSESEKEEPKHKKSNSFRFFPWSLVQHNSGKSSEMAIKPGLHS